MTTREFAVLSAIATAAGSDGEYVRPGAAGIAVADRVLPAKLADRGLLQTRQVPGDRPSRTATAFRPSQRGRRILAA